MKVVKSSLKDIQMTDHLSIALGTFDGVHRGHQRLIKQAVISANKRNIKSAVLTFNKHPLSVLKPESNVKIITDNETKAQLIESLEVDFLFFIDFNDDFANTEYIDFLKILKNQYNADVITCGYNYSFGKYGRGNPQLLNYHKDDLNYDLNVVEKISYKNHNISSSIIRDKIYSGKIDEANILLGYNYYCSGEVISGKKLGSTLDFPTANIRIDENLCLANGVYISMAYIEGKLYPSISNVGYTPTIESKHRTLETHIFNYSENLYGKHLKVELLSYVRGEIKFSSVTELKNRVFSDIETAKKYFLENLFTDNN
jgi:riboflavin kinase / FMN adenylyltransferase